MKEMTGWNTTEEEFDALPMAVRRKVCLISIHSGLIHFFDALARWLRGILSFEIVLDLIKLCFACDLERPHPIPLPLLFSFFNKTNGFVVMLAPSPSKIY